MPLNESADDKSQIEECLRDDRGEGIQHIALDIALATDDIYTTNESSRPAAAAIETVRYLPRSTLTTDSGKQRFALLRR